MNATDRAAHRALAEELAELLNRISALRHDEDQRAVFIVALDGDGVPVIAGTLACRRGRLHPRSWTLPRASALARGLLRRPLQPHVCGRDDS